MGRVFLGSSSAGKAVAVKIIHPEYARDPEFVRRFRREVQAAKVVSGAFTAPVVEADPDDDPPWLVTAFVPGPSLEELVAQAGPLPEAVVWRLAGGLAEALKAVHDCELVHRDLKPTNVLLAANGPKVIDFGISRALEGTALTGSRVTLGTPAFMSPEQAEGIPVGKASDVFALGSVIAFAATGTAPFGNGTPVAVAHRIIHAEPDLGDVPAGLRNMIAGCLAKDPADRPSLNQLIEATTIGSGPYPGASPVDFWPEPAAGLVRSREESFRGLVPHGAEPETAATLVLPHEPTTPGWEAQHSTTRSAGPARRVATSPQAPPSRLIGTLTAHGPASGMAFSPLGNILATCGDSGVWLWDPASGQHLRTLGGSASSVAFSPDGGLLASCHKSEVRLWDPVSGASLRTLSCAAVATAFSPDGRLLAVVRLLSRGSYGGSPYRATLQLWDPATGRHLRELTHDKSASSYSGPPDVLSLAFSPDGRILATGSSDATIRLWDPASGQHLRTIKGHEREVSCAAFSPDGRVLATGSSDATIRLWDPASGQHLRTIKGRITWHTMNGRIVMRAGALRRQTCHPAAVTFSPDGRVLAVANHELAHLWDPATGQHLGALAHKGSVDCVAFSPDGGMLATGGGESIVRLWG